MKKVLSMVPGTNVTPNVTPDVAPDVALNVVPCKCCCGGNQMNSGFKCYQCDYWRAEEDGHENYCRYYEKEGFEPDHKACSNFT